MTGTLLICLKMAVDPKGCIKLRHYIKGSLTLREINDLQESTFYLREVRQLKQLQLG